MISSDISIPAASQNLYGKTVGEMVTEDTEVLASGRVSGTFHYVTGYIGFNGDNVEEQEGYFFPFSIERSGETMTFKKNGVPVKEDIPWEADNVFRISKDDTFTVAVDGVDRITFDFSECVFEEKVVAKRARTTK